MMNWTIYDSTQFRDVRDEWNELNIQSAGTPLLDAVFFESALRHFGDGSERIAISRDNGRAVAAGLFLAKGRGVWETFAPGQAPLGAWIQLPGVSLEALLDGLRMALPGSCLSIGLVRLDPDFLARPQGMGRLSTLDYITTARLELDGTFDQYWKSRGKNLRHNVNRQRNLLAREGIRTRLEIVQDPDMAPQAVDEYGLLESQGWKGKEGTALHPVNPQGKFYRDILAYYCSKGEGVIYRYFYDDTLVATDLCVRRGGTITILKTTHDESQSKTSPALLLLQEIVQELFVNEDMQRLEFYGKVMDWHSKWTDVTRPMYHINFDRWPVFASLRKVARLR